MNKSKESYGGILQYDGTSTLVNNIIYNNVTTAFGQETSYFCQCSLFDSHISHNLFKAIPDYIFSNGGLTVSDLSKDSLMNLFVNKPYFIDSNDVDGMDGQFGSSDDGLILSLSSPALDAGMNYSDVLNIMEDYRGMPRIQNSRVDIGAYEGASLVGMHDNDFQKSSIFPNPSYGRININTERSAISITLKAIDGHMIRKIAPTSSKIVFDLDEKYNRIGFG